MNVHLITGGARSGKSRFAEDMAEELAAGDALTYIATAEAGDEEMAERIASHRQRRPAHWRTVEAPLDAPAAIIASAHRVVLLDCVTLYASNVFLRNVAGGADAACRSVSVAIHQLLDTAQQREGELILVTNEVGFGIVPDNPLARWFRDALGTANCTIANRATTVTLVVCGRALSLPVERE